MFLEWPLTEMSWSGVIIDFDEILSTRLTRFFTFGLKCFAELCGDIGSTSSAVDDSSLLEELMTWMCVSSAHFELSLSLRSSLVWVPMGCGGLWWSDGEWCWMLR